jgi:amidohydrolase
MQDIIDIIKSYSSEYFLDTIRLRRQIHQYPELSEHEFITARYIFTTLKSYGIEPHLLLNDTAVLATIEGREPSATMIALRAETDALPIEEKSDKVYISTNKGIMHACGHDVHTASLLTTARILQQCKDLWGGKILLIFQPSEEMYPGGAIRLIKEGILKEFSLNAMLAFHVSPEIETGKVGIKSGKFMASTDEIYVTVQGKAGHAALTQSFVNPINIAAHALIELDTKFKESAPENFPSVLTFGRIIGEGKTNIVPNEVHLEGTLRTFDEEWRKDAHKLIKKTFTKIAGEHNGNALIKIANGYPVLYNDETISNLCINYVQNYLGKENLIPLSYRMTSDDFASFSHEVPSLMYRLGVQIEGKDLNLHAPDFDINEKSLEFSPGIMAYFAINLLNHFQNNE